MEGGKVTGPRCSLFGPTKEGRTEMHVSKQEEKSQDFKLPSCCQAMIQNFRWGVDVGQGGQPAASGMGSLCVWCTAAWEGTGSTVAHRAGGRAAGGVGEKSQWCSVMGRTNLWHTYPKGWPLGFKLWGLQFSLTGSWWVTEQNEEREAYHNSH